VPPSNRRSNRRCPGTAMCAASRCPRGRGPTSGCIGARAVRSSTAKT